MKWTARVEFLVSTTLAAALAFAAPASAKPLSPELAKKVTQTVDVTFLFLTKK